MVTNRLSKAEALTLLRQHMPELERRFGISELALFGSTARDEATAESDVDILVSFEGDMSYRTLSKAETYLRELLGRPVDLVERRLLREEYRPWVEADEINPLNPRTSVSKATRPKRWDVYVQDMIDAALKTLRYTDGLELDDYLGDSRSCDATNLNMMQIGESAGKIPEPVREAHPEIDWGEAMGLRNRIVHAYPAIDDEKIWTIVKDFVPPLIPKLTALLAEAQAEAQESGK